MYPPDVVDKAKALRRAWESAERKGSAESHDPSTYSEHPYPQPPTDVATGENLGLPSIKSFTNASQHNSTANGGFSLSKLNRKQMEMDRQARSESRKRGVDQDDGNGPASKRSRQDKSSTSYGVNREPGTAVRRNQTFAEARLGDIPTPTYASPRAPDLPTPVEEAANLSQPSYLTPTIKKTWCFGQPRGDDVKIEEILQKDHLQLVALSTFQFDTAWWMSKIDPFQTKQLWIIGAQDKEMQASFAEAPNIIPRLTISFLDMSGIQVINHAKFFILSFPSFLRIVITTANLTGYDWGEGGDMENSVFLVDLPRLPAGHVSKEEDLTSFGRELLSYMRGIKARADTCNSLLKFDFSSTKDIAFVHSIGGTHMGDEAQRTGLSSLSRAVRSLSLQANSVEIDYATSSLGALKVPFLVQLLAAAQGQEVKPYNIKAKQGVPAAEVSSKVRVYFPTRDTITSSKGGPNAAGTITFMKKFYEASSFPKELMRDHKSTREGILSHSKIILARGQRKNNDDEEGENLAWVYVGSHNLTESAWGTMTTDRSTKSPKMSIRNYECGVVMKVPKEEAAKEDYHVFDGTMAIPFAVPGARYEDKLPWLMNFSN